MKKSALFSLVGLAVLWLVWIVAYYAVKNGFIFPSVKDTFSALGKLLGEGAFWRAFSNTLLRTFLAFLFSFALGTLLASLSALNAGVRAFFAPVLSVLRTVPTMAVVLLLLLWTSPAFAPVIVALLVLMPAVYACVLTAFTEAAKEYGDLAKAYHVSAGRRIFRMYVPLAAPAVLNEAGAIFSLGLKITISGEVLAATYRSLGGMMQLSQIYLETPRLFALTIVSVLLGFLLEGACKLIAKFALRWRA